MTERLIASLDWKAPPMVLTRLAEQGIRLHQGKRNALPDSCALVLASFNDFSATELSAVLRRLNPRPELILFLDEKKQAQEALALIPAHIEVLDANASESQILLSILRRLSLYEKRCHSDSVHSETAFEGIVAASHAMHEIFEVIDKVAAFNTTVLIQGESGTGKELVARAIHSRSLRRDNAFVALNCGAIPENLLESELFGHRKGSFTDAVRDKRGLFEEADGGTVFLDEIGELPVHLQVKMLRVLQEQAVHPIGAAEPIPVNIRIVAATLRNLEHDVEEGRFRDDLFYRLNVVPITVPPLRERQEDIDALLQHFLVKHRGKLGLHVYAAAPEVISLFHRYTWPGNVRELENTVERAMILCDQESIQPEHLPRKILEAARVAEEDSILSGVELDSLSIKHHVRLLEEHLIKQALEKTSGNRTHAAKLLEISHRTLLYKLKEYELGEEPN